MVLKDDWVAEGTPGYVEADWTYDPDAVNAVAVQVNRFSAQWVNVADYGATGDGNTDDTAAIRAAIAALPADGGTLYFPPGYYLCNAVDAGVILLMQNLPYLTLLSYGKGAVLTTDSATATEFVRVDTCTDFTMIGLQVEVKGTADIDKAVHFTTAPGTSCHRGMFQNLLIHNNAAGAVRYAYDGMTVSGSNIIYSGVADFAAGDVGAVVGINYGQVTPFRSTISTVQTLSATLSGNINSSTSTVGLNSALSTMPASGWSLKIGTEHMMVTAGGNTTTLTVIRGRGSDLYAASHSSGDTATVYKATLADNVTFDTDEAAAIIRIETKTAHMNYGLAIGMDHPGSSTMDLADTRLYSVVCFTAAIAGFSVGNGTSGNILAQNAYGITALDCMYGVYMNGGALSVHGADLSNNGIDIKRAQSVQQPITIDDVRSENSGMIYEYTGGTISGPVTSLSNWDAGLIYSENLVQLAHRSSAPLELRNMNLLVSTVAASWAQIVVAGGASNRGSLVAVNVSHNTGSTDPFVVTNASRTLLGVTQRDVDGAVIDQPYISGQVPTWVTAPSTAASAGRQGQMAMDATHIYQCIATDSWVRATMAAW